MRPFLKRYKGADVIATSRELRDQAVKLRRESVAARMRAEALVESMRGASDRSRRRMPPNVPQIPLGDAKPRDVKKSERTHQQIRVIRRVFDSAQAILPVLVLLHGAQGYPAVMQRCFPPNPN